MNNLSKRQNVDNEYNNGPTPDPWGTPCLSLSSGGLVIVHRNVVLPIHEIRGESG